MTIDHVAIWTENIEELKDFYVQNFDGKSNGLYHNLTKNFKSYFIEFGSGSRLELMTKSALIKQENSNPDVNSGICHIAFGLDTSEEVEAKALQLLSKGYEIIDGPRITGDGYFEFVTRDIDGNIIEVSTKF
jgi:lactoylglutathione lyase